jgi:hypothetical protein
LLKWSALLLLGQPEKSLFATHSVLPLGGCTVTVCVSQATDTPLRCTTSVTSYVFWVDPSGSSKTCAAMYPSAAAPSPNAQVNVELSISSQERFEIASKKTGHGELHCVRDPLISASGA